MFRLTFQPMRKRWQPCGGVWTLLYVAKWKAVRFMLLCNFVGRKMFVPTWASYGSYVAWSRFLLINESKLAAAVIIALLIAPFVKDTLSNLRPRDFINRLLPLRHTTAPRRSHIGLWGSEYLAGCGDCNPSLRVTGSVPTRVKEMITFGSNNNRLHARCRIVGCVLCDRFQSFKMNFQK